MDDELQREIERVAKLRGVPAPAIVEPSRRLSADEVRAVFRIPANPVAADLRVFDELPARSRQALRELRLQTHSPTYLDLLERIGDERALIAAVQAEEAAIIRLRRPL